MTNLTGWARVTHAHPAATLGLSLPVTTSFECPKVRSSLLSFPAPVVSFVSEVAERLFPEPIGLMQGA